MIFFRFFSKKLNSEYLRTYLFVSIILIPKNIYFEAIQHVGKTQRSWLVQKFVFWFLLAEKSKPHEIYRWMRVCGKECFSQKINLSNGIKIGLLLPVWVEKLVHRMQTRWLFSKEKFRAQRSLKNVMLTVIRNIYINWFLLLTLQEKSAFFICRPSNSRMKKQQKQKT